MNFNTKIVVGADKKDPIKLIWRSCIKPISSSVYLKEAKRNNHKIMQIDS